MRPPLEAGDWKAAEAAEEQPPGMAFDMRLGQAGELAVGHRQPVRRAGYQGTDQRTEQRGTGGGNDGHRVMLSRGRVTLR